MATAVVEERQLLKSLRWWDGFTIALANPGFLLASLLGAYGALGVVGATGYAGSCVDVGKQTFCTGVIVSQRGQIATLTNCPKIDCCTRRTWP